MDQARPANPKLLTAQEAAEKLAVSINVLLAWKKRGLLVPSVSRNGKSYYSEYQVQKFLENRPLKNISQIEVEAKTQDQTEFSKEAGRALSENKPQDRRDEETSVSPSSTRETQSAPEKAAPSSTTQPSLFSTFFTLLSGKLYEDEFSKNYFNPPSDLIFGFKPSKKAKALFPVIALSVALGILGLMTQQNRIKFLVERLQTTNYNQQVGINLIKGPAVLASETSKYKITGSILFTLPLNVKEDVSLGKNLLVEGQSVFKGNITAPNILYGVKAGDHIIVTNAQSQTPTISADLSGVVATLQGQTGDISLTAGTDISISGLTISNTSTLASVANRGGCSSCITDADVSNSLTIDSTGQISGTAITSGVVGTTVGGTGVTSYATGDLLYASGANILSTLTASQAGQFLIMGVTGTPQWGSVSSFAVATVEQNGTTISTATNTLNFTNSDFNLSESPAGRVNIQLASVLNSVTGVANSFNIQGSSLTFTGNGLITSGSTGSLTLDSASTGSVNIATGSA